MQSCVMNVGKFCSRVHFHPLILPYEMKLTCHQLMFGDNGYHLSSEELNDRILCRLKPQWRRC
jgi:hypothetical protein